MLTCGWDGCGSTELWADGLCEFHADPRRVMPGDLQPEFRRLPRLPRRLRLPVPDDHPELTGAPSPEGLTKVLAGEPACGLETAHLFEPWNDGETEDHRRRRYWEAARLCADCPVRTLCEDMLGDLAATAPELRGGHGVWAGRWVRSCGVEPVTDPDVVNCSRCRRDLPIEAYHPRVARGSEHRTCRECWAESTRKRRERPEVKAREAQRAREKRAAETPEQREHRLGIKRRSERRAKERRAAERAGRTGERVA